MTDVRRLPSVPEGPFLPFTARAHAALRLHFAAIRSSRSNSYRQMTSGQAWGA
jgi:hypothetical protein